MPILKSQRWSSLNAFTFLHSIPRCLRWYLLSSGCKICFFLQSVSDTLCSILINYFSSCQFTLQLSSAQLSFCAVTAVFQYTKLHIRQLWQPACPHLVTFDAIKHLINSSSQHRPHRHARTAQNLLRYVFWPTTTTPSPIGSILSGHYRRCHKLAAYRNIIDPSICRSSGSLSRM